MASKTEICNLAISHLGVGSEIANVDTEASNEAAACRRFYEMAKDATLRDFPWPFATKIAELGLVEEDPNDEWGYSYRYPSDCKYFRRILSGVRNDSRSSRVAYKISQDASGQLIFTDYENAEGEYTVQEDDPALYPPDFVMALSFRLAAYIAPRLTGADPYKMGERAMKLYQFELNKAHSNAFNEEQPDEMPESEFIRGRE